MSIARTILTKFLSKETQIALIEGISRLKIGLWPFQISFGEHREGLSRVSYLEVLEVIKPGDIILRSHKNMVGNLISGGKLTHVGVYVGDGFNGKYSRGVIHATYPKVIVDELQAFLVCDAISIWRPSKELSPEQIDIIIKRAKNIINKDTRYDYDYLSDLTSSEELSSSEMYCSELAVFCYKEVGPECPKFNKVKKLNEEVYQPDSFLLESNGWKNIYFKYSV